MSARTVVILAALHDEVSPLVRKLALQLYDGVWLGAVGATNVAVRVSGVGAAKAGREMEDLIAAHRPVMVINPGFAGGLDAALAGGALVSPRWVIDGRGSAYALDPTGQRPPVLGADTPSRPAADTLISVAQPLLTPDAKRREAQRSRAAVADMETYHLAAIAARRAVPLVALRAVSDPADLALPPQALSWVKPDGQSDAKAASRFALTHPAWMPTLMKLGKHARLAAANLADAIERMLQLPD